MDVWVAGATGVLGRRTVKMLLEAGHTVTGLARDLSKWPDAPPEMRFLPCDITVAGQVIQAFAKAKPDVVMHLATALPVGRPMPKDWLRNDAVRREGTQNLTEAALLADAYYVHQSVHYVLAPQGDNWITEDSPFKHSDIMKSAIEAERITHRAIQHGMRGCILRPAAFYSADSEQTRSLVHAIKTGMPILIGGGENYWSLIHPIDVAAAIVRVLEVMPPGETINLCDDEPVRMGDCLKWIAQTVHAHPPKTVAAFLAKVALGAETVDLLTASRRMSNAKAKAVLGWKPRYATFKAGFTAEMPAIAA